MKLLKPDLRLNCFSPPVMIATFVVEIALAVYTFWRYKLDRVTRVVMLIFVLLAVFQLAEFNVCAAGWINPAVAARLGFCAITMLPPLGLHLIYAVSRARIRPLVWLAHLSGLTFIAWFLSDGSSFSSYLCTGNYAIFQLSPVLGDVYGYYYFGWLGVAIWLSWRFARGEVRKAMLGILAGYLAFMVPTGVVITLFPDSGGGIPSMMCGFAVLFALIVGLWVLPHSRATKR